MGAEQVGDGDVGGAVQGDGHDDGGDDEPEQFLGVRDAEVEDEQAEGDAGETLGAEPGRGAALRAIERATYQLGDQEHQ